MFKRIMAWIFRKRIKFDNLIQIDVSNGTSIIVLLTRESLTDEQYEIYEKLFSNFFGDNVSIGICNGFTLDKVIHIKDNTEKVEV